jgi:hypothetical protein
VRENSKGRSRIKIQHSSSMGKLKGSRGLHNHHDSRVQTRQTREIPQARTRSPVAPSVNTGAKQTLAAVATSACLSASPSLQAAAG